MGFGTGADSSLRALGKACPLHSILGNYDRPFMNVSRNSFPTRVTQCGTFLVLFSKRKKNRCVRQAKRYYCRHSSWGVSCLAERMGACWLMGWLERQLGMLVLGGNDRAGKIQLEKRGRFRPR